MKRLLTVAIIASTLLLSAQTLRAEDDAPRHPRHSSEQMVERMSQGLNLTEEQKNNIVALKKAEFEKIRAIREENRTKMEGYLTDEQKQQLEQRKQSRNKDCMGKGKGRNDSDD
jgi:Spy/CpxP family protein refolding chaperone